MKCPKCNREIENTPFDEKYIKEYEHCIFCDLIDPFLMSERTAKIINDMKKEKENDG